LLRPEDSIRQPIVPADRFSRNAAQESTASPALEIESFDEDARWMVHDDTQVLGFDQSEVLIHFDSEAFRLRTQDLAWPSDLEAGRDRKLLSTFLRGAGLGVPAAEVGTLLEVPIRVQKIDVVI